MKSFFIIIIGGAILGGVEGGTQGIIIGIAGAFCLWVLYKIMRFLNRNADKIADQFDDDD